MLPEASLRTQTDWSQVWYDPIGEPDDEGGAEYGLYRYPTGEPGKREPMKGTVMWLPFFDPDSFESGTKKERTSMQEQVLFDTWNLLGAASLEEVDEIECSLLDLYPGDRKRAIIAEAKKVVLERLGRRGQRQGRRQNKRTRTGGQPGKGKERAEDGESGYGGSDSNMSDSDEEDELQQMRHTAFERRVMPPPKRPTKGKAAALSSKARATPSTATTRSPSMDLTMSGGIGVRASTESEQDFEREPIGGSPTPRRSASRPRSERGASAGDAKRSREESAELPPRKRTPGLGPSIFKKSTAAHLPTPATPQDLVRRAGEDEDDASFDDDADDGGWSRTDMLEAMRRSLPPR